MDQKAEEKNFYEQVHSFYNEKEKSYITLKLEQEEKYILITYSKTNTEITHRTKYTFNKIKDNDIEFFYPFNNDINLLFKFLYRICKVNYYQLNFDRNDNVIMTLLCFFHKSMKFINIIIPKIQDNEEVNNYLDSKEEEENNNRPCPPVINGNVFIYLTKRKEEYKIEITKSDYAIIFSILERQNENEKEDESKEFLAIRTYEDFLYLSGYYYLFNGSLDDIYSDLLFNFYNNNFELRKVKKEIKIYFYVFNLKQINNREAYFCVNISTKLKLKEQEQKNLEAIKPIMSSIIKIKNEVIHLNLGNKEKLNIGKINNSDDNEEKEDDNEFGNSNNENNINNNDNNFDEETDTKNNLDDFKNDIQTFINGSDQKILERIEIKKNELNISNLFEEKEEKELEDDMNIDCEIKKQDKFLVTKIIGVTNNKYEEKNMNETMIKGEKLVVKDAFCGNSGLKIKCSNIPLTDKKEEQKDNEINSNKNFNFINSIIINYVDMNNPEKRKEIYNFVLDNINNEKYQNLEKLENKDENIENDILKNHQINLGKTDKRHRKEKKIKKIQNRFLRRKRKNNYTISKYFNEKPINQTQEKEN